MKDKRTTNAPNEPLIDVTWNIITDKETALISCIATRRKPSNNEVNRCDWHMVMRRGGVRIHVIGRGDQLTDVYLRQLAAAYCDGLPVWKSIDLSKPDDPVGDLFQSAEWQELAAMAVKI